MKISTAIALAAAFSLWVVDAWAHPALVTSAPAQGASVAGGTKEIRLTFNEALEPAFSTINVTGTGVDVPLGKVQPVEGDPRSLVLPLPAVMAPAAYVARWSVMGKDGHRVRGEVAFTVK